MTFNQILYQLIIYVEKEEILYSSSQKLSIIFLRKLMKDVLYQNKLVIQEWENNRLKKI